MHTLLVGALVALASLGGVSAKLGWCETYSVTPTTGMCASSTITGKFCRDPSFVQTYRALLETMDTPATCFAGMKAVAQCQNYKANGQTGADISFYDVAKIETQYCLESCRFPWGISRFGSTGSAPKPCDEDWDCKFTDFEWRPMCCADYKAMISDVCINVDMAKVDASQWCKRTDGTPNDEWCYKRDAAGSFISRKSSATSLSAFVALPVVAAVLSFLSAMYV